MITILYVEDNFENRILVKRLVNAAGYLLLEAESAAMALQLLQENKPDLILVDINLPEVDGYELTTRIRSDQSLNSIPIIAVTANVLKSDQDLILRSGCNGYIYKPIDVDNFIEKLNLYLSRQEIKPT